MSLGRLRFWLPAGRNRDVLLRYHAGVLQFVDPFHQRVDFGVEIFSVFFSEMKLFAACSC
jgi:hypothetical protein